MNISSRLVVTAAEFTRQFGQLRQALGDAPVFVTHHGRETHVLITKARYDILRAATPAPDASAQDEVFDLVRQGIVELDHALIIRRLNRAALRLLDIDIDPVGHRFIDVVPAVADSVLETYLRRSIGGGEATQADLPNPTRPHAWLSIATQPVSTGVTLLLTDITHDVQRERLADRPKATALATALHPAIGVIRLSARGTIVAADEASCDMVKLEQARLRRVALADLVPTAKKPELRHCLEQVLDGRGARVCDTQLLANDGTSIPVQLTVSELRGIYGLEGAIVIAVRH